LHGGPPARYTDAQAAPGTIPERRIRAVGRSSVEIVDVEDWVTDRERTEYLELF
jgi:hypothetical protein